MPQARTSSTPQDEPSCFECAAKHLACAWIRLDEARRGYPGKFVTALGDLEEAVRELQTDHPDLAAQVYAEKKNIAATFPEISRGGLWGLLLTLESLWQDDARDSHGGQDA